VNARNYSELYVLRPPDRAVPSAKPDCLRIKPQTSEGDHEQCEQALHQIEAQGCARPDSIVPGQSRRQIFMRRYLDAILETEMLLRVVVEETDTQLTVVTLYKTSKFAKYEGGA